MSDETEETEETKSTRNMVVWKYEIGLGSCFVEVPQSATVLHVNEQGGKIMAWCFVSPDADTTKTKKVLFIGTGQEAELGGWKYINTFMLEGGQFVFHAFAEPTLGDLMGRMGMFG